MKTSKLKAIVIGCLTVMLLTGVLSGCSCRIGPEIYEEGYFKYSLVEINENIFSQIEGLTEDGTKQKILVLPETLGDYALCSVGVSMLWGYRGEWESENLEKLFVPIKVEMEIYFKKCPNLLKIFAPYLGITLGQTSKPRYYCSYHLNTIKDGSNRLEQGFCSNISYMYNYEECPNDGYYWIDDLDYGSKIDWQPAEPTRKGYTFGGWYKEEECINAWDFASDTLPQEEKTDEGIVKYRETRLYAKWD